MGHRARHLVSGLILAVVSACDAAVSVGLDGAVAVSDAAAQDAEADAGPRRDPVCDQPVGTARDAGSAEIPYFRLAPHSAGCVDYQVMFTLRLGTSPPALSGGLYVCNRCSESRFLDWVPVEDDNALLVIGGSPPQVGYRVHHGVYNAGPWLGLEWVDSAGRSLPELNCLTRDQILPEPRALPQTRLELKSGERLYLAIGGALPWEGRNQGLSNVGYQYGSEFPFWDRVPDLLDPNLVFRITYPILRDASQSPRPEFIHQVRCDQAGLPFERFRLQDQYPWSITDWPVAAYPVDFLTPEDLAASASGLEQQRRMRR